MEDRKIIQLYRQRNQAAIEETDRKYGAGCRRMSMDILRCREDAEECVNDGYLALWKSIPPQYPQSLGAYLYRTVRNFCFDRLREAAALKRGRGELQIMLDELEGCLTSGESVEKQYEAKELSEEINRFLSSLSKDDRVIFNCRYWLGLPTAEIAARMKAKDSKVRTSLHRSRKKLREHLEKEGLL